MFSSLSAGYTSTNKKETWEAVTRTVDAVSGEGRTIEEVKKNGLILNQKQTKKTSQNSDRRRNGLEGEQQTPKPCLSWTSASGPSLSPCLSTPDFGRVKDVH